MSERPGSELSEFTGAFVAEADELLANATTQLLAAEEAGRKDQPHPRGVREAFRAVHTIKGLAGMVGVEPIVAVAHRMEATLRRADRTATRLSQEALDLLLEGLRTIQRAVRALAEGRPIAQPPPALLEGLEALDDGAQVPAEGSPSTLAADPLLEKLGPADREQLRQGLAEGRRAVRADFFPSPERAAAGLNITSVRERVGAHAEIVKVLPLAVPVSPDAPAGLGFALILLTGEDDAALGATYQAPAGAVRSLSEPRPVTPAGGAPLWPGSDVAEDAEPLHRGVVRVEVGRLDETMERLSTVIVTRYRLAKAAADLAARGADTRELQLILRENARQLRDLRSAILRVRMIRVTELLERVPLILRNLRRTTGKKVRLETDAGAAELDKTVAERIFPAVIHLVRNAVDHAIEAPAERLRLGKPEEGLLRIRCVERSNAELELSVTDDGRGIDREQVARRAGVAVPRTDAELLQLICRPGLSTREEATTTSGRGMGMDIVRKIAMEQLGGELSLRTEPGRGTTFTMRVPLTISIVDAFSFECAHQRFVAPVATIEEIVEVSQQQIVRGPNPAAAVAAPARVGIMERRGQPVPLVRLDAIFTLPDAAEHAPKVLVVRRGGAPLGFMVDRMLGQQEVVVRPLDDALVRVPGVGGSTDLGDGQPTLVLDLPALADYFTQVQEGVARA